MLIPELNENGFLPEGIHEASLEEIRERFGRFQRTDRRPALFTKFSLFMVEVRASGRNRGANMIENDAQLVQTLEAMGLMYRALASLRKEVLPKSRQWFNLMAEGPVDEIRKMQREIDVYTGMTEVVFHDEDDPESADAEAHAEIGSVES